MSEATLRHAEREADRDHTAGGGCCRILGMRGHPGAVLRLRKTVVALWLLLNSSDAASSSPRSSCNSGANASSNFLGSTPALYSATGSTTRTTCRVHAAVAVVARLPIGGARFLRHHDRGRGAPRRETYYDSERLCRYTIGATATPSGPTGSRSVVLVDGIQRVSCGAGEELRRQYDASISTVRSARYEARMAI